MSDKFLHDYHTWRGIDDMESGNEPYHNIFGFKNKAEFVEYIRHKEVLDLGSGYGGLTHDLYGMNFQSGGHVLSVNPEINHPNYRYALPFMIKATLSKVKVDGTPKSNEELDSEVVAYTENYFKKAVAAKWAGKFINKKGQEEKFTLPFRDGVFDMILSSYSFSYYSDHTDIPRALEDMVRILKPGGELRIVPIRVYSHHNVEMDERYQLIFKVLKEMPGIEYKMMPLADQIYNYIVVRKAKEEKV